MHLDVATLMMAGSFVAALSGGFTFYVWITNRGAHGFRWFGFGFLFYCAGVALLVAGLTGAGQPLIAAGATVLNLAPALFWAGARRLHGRRVPLAGLAAGTVIAVALNAVPAFAARPELSAALSLATFAIYGGAAMFEFWRDRGERLAARWPLVNLLGLQSGFMLVGAGEAAFGLVPLDRPAPLGSAFGFVHFVSIIFLCGMAIFLVAFIRERSEAMHRSAAATDALTGVATRGAFLDYAGTCLDRSRAAASPLALVIFDVDRFKSVNDTFGHGIGDSVLRIFAAVARAELRDIDRIGRLGGEEFAVVLPGASMNAALGVANRIREAFAAAAATVEDHPVGSTMSGGVAVAGEGMTLESLLAIADAGLYRAKALGRNRVERAPARNGQHLNQVA